MIILGIDPGSRVSGFGVIKQINKKMEYIASGVLKYNTELNFLDRLGEVYAGSRSLIKKFRPDHIALESLIYRKNVNSLTKLAQARGAMIAAFASDYNENVFEYSPNLVKSVVSGHGHGTKEVIEKILISEFGEINFPTHDASDALAICVCHALMVGKQNHQIRDKEIEL